MPNLNRIKCVAVASANVSTTTPVIAYPGTLVAVVVSGNATATGVVTLQDRSADGATLNALAYQYSCGVTGAQSNTLNFGGETGVLVTGNLFLQSCPAGVIVSLYYASTTAIT